jgi:hypothetical protein
MEFYSKVEQATVRIKERGSPKCDEIPQCFESQGVVVPNGYIITATHCFNWKWVEQAARKNYYPVCITNRDGEKSCNAVPVVIEPILDIAVLGNPDKKPGNTEWDQYVGLIGDIEPLQICTDYKLIKNYNVHTFTHKNKWVMGEMINEVDDSNCINAHVLCARFKDEIEKGTSGGPIVNDDGKLIAVVSKSDTGIEFRNPYIYQCLPRWIMDKILE